jgi:hypothetical protein
MTTLDIWINRRPEDEFADQLTALLNVPSLTASQRREAMDELAHHFMIDPSPPAAGECGWCSTRQRLATMPDGRSRLPQFGRLMMSSSGRRAIGAPCPKCTRIVMDVIRRRVDRPKSSAGAVKVEPSQKLAAPDQTLTASAGKFRSRHDPFNNCSTCREWRRNHPATRTLTAGGIPQGCPPHAWNEPTRRTRR